MRHLIPSVLALVVVLAPAGALGQTPSRAARVLTLLAGDSVGALVARDRVFVPDASLRALSACSGSRCAPVRSTEACQVPRCPGQGTLLVLEGPIADVSDLPTDRSGFTRALDAMRVDPSLGAIAWSFGYHPEPAPEPAPPPRWLTSARIDHVGWELGAYAIGGALAGSGVGFVGGEVSGGFRFTWDPRTEEDDLLAIIFGDVLGLDVRVRALDVMPPQRAEQWALTVGLAPAMGYASRSEVFRLPTFYSCFLPEIGVALRADRDAAWYAGWSLPLTFLVDEHLGLEARASVLIVDDWAAGDDVEAIVSLGLGLVPR